MKRKNMRKIVVENMDNMVNAVRKCKNISEKEELWINKVRIDQKWNTMYIEYEGKTRIGFLLYDFVEKEKLLLNSWIFGQDIVNSCLNLINHSNKYWAKDRDIVEFRFKK